MIRRQCLSAPVLPRRERGGDAVRVGLARGPGPGARARRVVASSRRRVGASSGRRRLRLGADRDNVPLERARRVDRGVLPIRSGFGPILPAEARPLGCCPDPERQGRAKLRGSTQNPSLPTEIGTGGYPDALSDPESLCNPRRWERGISGRSSVRAAGIHPRRPARPRTSTRNAQPPLLQCKIGPAHGLIKSAPKGKTRPCVVGDP